MTRKKRQQQNAGKYMNFVDIHHPQHLSMNRSCGSLVVVHFFHCSVLFSSVAAINSSNFVIIIFGAGMTR